MLARLQLRKAPLRALGSDYLVINGSDEGRFLDTVRNQAKAFASTVSLTSEAKHKVIIIDEADNTTPDVQLLLRACMEEFNKVCRFIFTCNYKNKIIEPLHSRCAVVDFSLKGSEKTALAGAFFKRTQEILTAENVDFEPKVVAALVKKYFPDFRRTINELQRYSAKGQIDAGVLANGSDVKIQDLVGYLRNREFTNMKKWVVQNLDNEPTKIMRKVYDSVYDFLSPKSIPEAVLIIGEYQYKSAFVVDHEINLVCFLTEIMMRCEFK